METLFKYAVAALAAMLVYFLMFRRRKSKTDGSGMSEAVSSLLLFKFCVDLGRGRHHRAVEARSAGPRT